VGGLTCGSQLLHQWCKAIAIAPRRADGQALRGKLAHDRAADGVPGADDQGYPCSQLPFSQARIFKGSKKELKIASSRPCVKWRGMRE
jgi:hypothetical protein